MSEASRVNSHRPSLKSEGTVSQNSEMDDYVVATLETDERRTPCHQCYQARQLSMHENRERHELMRSESVRSTSIQIENDGAQCRLDKKNTRNNKLSENVANVPIDRKDGVSRVQIPYLDRPPRRRVSSVSTVRLKKKRNCNSCYCFGLSLSVCLSLLALGGVVYMYLNRNNIVQPVLSTKPEQPTEQPRASAMQGQVTSSRVTGRFGLDQDAFIESSKTLMRWNAIHLSGSPILTSTNDSCLIVPERGTYGVFSVLTFSIKKEDTVTKLAHYMRLEGFQEGETSFQRKLFAVPVPENRNNLEAIPSSLVSFVAMEAKGRICIYTAEAKMKYLYVSRLDNTVNIFKV